MVNDLNQTAPASQEKFLSENELLARLPICRRTALIGEKKLQRRGRSTNPKDPKLIRWVMTTMLLVKLVMILFRGQVMGTQIGLRAESPFRAHMALDVEIVDYH